MKRNSGTRKIRNPIYYSNRDHFYHFHMSDFHGPSGLSLVFGNNKPQRQLLQNADYGILPLLSACGSSSYAADEATLEY